MADSVPAFAAVKFAGDLRSDVVPLQWILEFSPGTCFDFKFGEIHLVRTNKFHPSKKFQKYFAAVEGLGGIFHIKRLRARDFHLNYALHHHNIHCKGSYVFVFIPPFQYPKKLQNLLGDLCRPLWGLQRLANLPPS